MSTDETPFAIWGSGAAASKARRRQDVVLHTAGPWSRSVMALLRHLEAVGFEGAPRPVGDGFGADGREVITYVPGTTPHPRAWDDHAIGALGALVRRLHDATESFQPPADASWQPSFARLLPGNHPVFGHGDTGPWNVVAQGGVPVAFIDWEFAGPVDALWELAETAWLNAQLHDDDIAERVGLPPAARRGQQVRLLLDAYGLPAAERVGFVDQMIEFAVHSARAEAVRYGVAADTAAGVDPSGYPVLWAITWRARSASWMLRHRQILERALTLASDPSAVLLTGAKSWVGGRWVKILAKPCKADRPPELRIRGMERVTGIDPALSAWDAAFVLRVDGDLPYCAGDGPRPVRAGSRLALGSDRSVRRLRECSLAGRYRIRVCRSGQPRYLLLELQGQAPGIRAVAARASLEPARNHSSQWRRSPQPRPATEPPRERVRG